MDPDPTCELTTDPDAAKSFETVRIAFLESLDPDPDPRLIN